MVARYRIYGMDPSIRALFGARLVLGAGESVAYPAYSQILVQHFPENRRGVANSLLEAAAKIGPAVSTLIGGLLVARFGWRALFLCLGIVSLTWLVPWILWGPTRGASTTKTEGSRISAAQIMRRREAWGTSLGMFALGYVWSFLLSWLPTYLVNERGFSLRMVAVLGSLPFWAMAGTAVFGGWLSDRWIASGGSVTRVRKTFMNTGLLICGATLLPAAAVRDTTTAMVLLIISSAALGLFTSNVWAVTQTLAGPRAAGSLDWNTKCHRQSRWRSVALSHGIDRRPDGFVLPGVRRVLARHRGRCGLLCDFSR